MLVLRGKQPWELLLMRRPGGADFAPDAYVFPGGSVHADDSESSDPIAAAAVRELFEDAFLDGAASLVLIADLVGHTCKSS